MNYNWNDAIPLRDAWFFCVSEELRDRYRNYGGSSKAASDAIKFEMRGSLIERLRRGECRALGIMIEPIMKDHAEAIPPIFFQAQNNIINWELGEIARPRRKFEEVRIIENTEITVANNTIDVQMPLSNKRGGGRPSQYPKIKIILGELWENPACRNMRAAQLLLPFNKKFVARFSTEIGAVAPVSERSLREHLKQYRRELAGIGNN